MLASVHDLLNVVICNCSSCWARDSCSRTEFLRFHLSGIPTGCRCSGTAELWLNGLGCFHINLPGFGQSIWQSFDQKHAPAMQGISRGSAG